MDSTSSTTPQPQPGTVLRLVAALAASDSPVTLAQLARALSLDLDEISRALGAIAGCGLPVAIEGEGPGASAWLAHPGPDAVQLSSRSVARLGAAQVVLNALLPASMADPDLPPLGTRPLGRPSPLPSAPGWPAETAHDRDARLGRTQDPGEEAERDGAQGDAPEEVGGNLAAETAESPVRVTRHPLAAGGEQAARAMLDALRQRRTCRATWIEGVGEERATLAPMRVYTVHDAVWFTCWRVGQEGLAAPVAREPVFIAAHRLCEATLEERSTAQLPMPEPRRPDLFGGDYNRPFQMQVVVSQPAAAYVEERVWDEDQSTTRMRNGDILLDIGSASPEAALSFVLSLGSCARVITPSWLRKRVVATCRAIIERDGQPSGASQDAEPEPAAVDGEDAGPSSRADDERSRPRPNAAADGRARHRAAPARPPRGRGD